MQYLTSKIKKEIVRFSERNPAIESGGLIFQRGKSIVALPCLNVSPTPKEHFLIAQEEIAVHSAPPFKILAFWHTHVDTDSSPSEGDKLVAERYNINSIVYSLKDHGFNEYEPIGLEVPFVGRNFYFGLQDCVQLVIDYYQRRLNINLPYPVESPFLVIPPDQWASHPDNRKDNYFVRDYFAKFGFSEASNLKKDDVLVFSFGIIKAPCHLAVYLGNGRILHHRYEMISEESIYNNYWKRHLCHILRHKDIV